MLKLNINEGYVNSELEFTNTLLSNQCTVSNMLVIGERYHELVRSYRVRHDEFLYSLLFTKSRQTKSEFKLLRSPHSTLE